MDPPDLLAACQSPGFTPSRRQLPILFALLGLPDRKAAEKVVQALARAEAPAGRAALDALATAVPPARARLLLLLGRIAQRAPHPDFLQALLAAVGDADLKTRRNAVIALGKLGTPAAEERLLAYWPTAPLEHRRSIAQALGKTGAVASLELLRSLQTDDAELGRIATRAELMLERSLTRPSDPAILLDAPLGVLLNCTLFCRAGLGRLLGEELRAWVKPERVLSNQVEVRWSGDLRGLLRSRIALEIGFRVRLDGALQTLEQRMVEALRTPTLKTALCNWSRDTPRFRVQWDSPGHRRAELWRIAEEVKRASLGVINDSRQASWEARIVEASPEPHLVLIPRGFLDPRFAYRTAEVPAASHPTVAAALSLQSRVTPSDVVWDPFVGSGLELVEVARLAAPRQLHGSDTDPRAIAAARINLEKARIDVTTLSVADARSHRVPGATLIITNPPMGRRVVRDGTLSELLESFLRRAKASLVSGGRVVWLSPLPTHTAEVGGRLGYQVERFETVDMGGFRAELQTLRKR